MPQALTLLIKKFILNKHKMLPRRMKENVQKGKKNVQMLRSSMVFYYWPWQIIQCKPLRHFLKCALNFYSTVTNCYFRRQYFSFQDIFVIENKLCFSLLMDVGSAGPFSNSSLSLNSHSKVNLLYNFSVFPYVPGVVK